MAVGDAMAVYYKHPREQLFVFSCSMTDCLSGITKLAVFCFSRCSVSWESVLEYEIVK